jgi:hypothetical protein
MKDDVLSRAKKRFESLCSIESGLRREALEDLKFRAGRHWSEGAKQERQSPNEERPLLTVNKSRRFINLLINDGRMQRPTIQVRAAGGAATRQVAQIYENFMRAIQMDSRADIAYDTALESAATIGWGYWRIITEYESDISFDQVIRIERILDTFSVYLDDTAEADGTGARFAFIMASLPKEELEADYPDRQFIPWDGASPGDDSRRAWYDGKNIRIAEYWEVESEQQTLYLLPNGITTFEKPEDAALILAERDVDVQTVKWYKLTGATYDDEPLEETEWLGKEIPIIRVVGDEYRLDGKTWYEGILRHAKDSMKAYDYWYSSLVEQVALAPKSPYIAALDQVSGHLGEWRTANTSPKALLLYTPSVDPSGNSVPPPIRVPAPEVSTGILSALQIADKDVMDTIGFYQANLGEPSNERSGKAITRRQQQGELGMSHYLDNWSRSLVRTGRILLDLIPKVYDTTRALRTVGEDDRVQPFLNSPAQPVPMQQRMVDGQQIAQVNLSLGRYDVAVTVGPSYQSRRQEAAEGMLNFLKLVPQIAQVTADLVVKNMDWPGADEFRDRLERLLPPDVLNPGNAADTPEIRSAKNQIAAKAKQLQQQAQQLMQAQQQLQQVNQVREKEVAKMEFRAFKEKAQAELKELKARYTNQITQLRQQIVREREKAVKAPVSITGERVQ